MQQTHLPPRPINLHDSWTAEEERAASWYALTQACWSLTPSGVAVVFVHGFAGDALGSWHQFSSLWPGTPATAGCDLIFYGYESVTQQVGYSGNELRDFLERFFADPAAKINQSIQHLFHLGAGLKRAHDFRYRRIVLVAHSLGAVIGRRALLGAYQNRHPWVEQTRLVLFAPAHKGALVKELVETSLAVIPFGSVVSAGATWKAPSVHGLAQGSTELKALEDETKTVLALRPDKHEPFAAAQVIFGQRDKIVIQDQFAGDTPATPFPGRNHIDVCKPTQSFPRPLDIVMKVL